ncbi:ROK family protein [Homoserinimonas sp. A447]
MNSITSPRRRDGRGGRGLVSQLREGPARDRRIVGIGLAVPGLVRESDGMVRWAPHLGWSEVAFRSMVEAATGLPAFADNDATLGALAERLFGGARN